MAEFLNKKKLLEWVPKLIETAERELVIISPYVQISDQIFSLLEVAEHRNVEITLVYKENELNAKERKRFDGIKNLNLLSHPNLHSKCIYNEKYLLISTMNLYDYSFRNNREMGVLFRRTSQDEISWNDIRTSKDDDSVFQDAIEEIQSIINSANFEKESFETKTIGFEMDIIKSNKELAQEYCNRINKFSKNKKFTVFHQGEEWLCRCDNFLDGVDLIIEKSRISISLNFDGERIEKLYDVLKTNKYDGRQDHRVLDCFRLFWTFPKSSPTLYQFNDHATWQLQFDSDEFLQAYMIGLNSVLNIFKQEISNIKK